MKDRRAAELLRRFSRKGYRAVAAITSGNTGYSLGFLARAYDMKDVNVFSVVDENTDGRILEQLGSVSTVIKTNLSERLLTSKDVINLVREKTGYAGSIADASNTSFSWVDSYFAICSEIFSGIQGETGRFPHYIIVPVGSGELFVSFDVALLEFESSAALIGVTVSSNPISELSGSAYKNTNSQSIADKLSACFAPMMNDVQRSLSHSNKTISGLRKIIVAEEGRIAETYAFLKNKLHLSVEPSSAAAFVALDDLKGKVHKQDIVVVVNTGRGLFFD